MRRNQVKTQIYFTVVIFISSMALWLAGCAPDEDVVEVTVRPTVEVGGTAVTPTMISTPQPISTPITISVLPNPVPPLPGMLYHGPNGQGTWLVGASGQSQKISELQIFPKFLADNNRFAYLQDENLWEVNRDSGIKKLLASIAGLFFRWSSFSADAGIIWFLDGTGADFYKGGQLGKLKFIDGDGNILTLSENYLYRNPVLSPDRNSIAFNDDGQPVVYQLDSGEQLLSLADLGFSAEFVWPFWSLDQTKLAWTAYEANRTTNAYKIVIFNLEKNTTETVEVDGQTSWDISEVRWHPDGTKLAIIRQRGSSVKEEFEIWILDLNTREVSKAGNGYFAQWSPNGQWLAYSQELDDYKGSIWVRSVDGREQYQIGEGHSVIWSPDSRFLMYCGPERRGFEGQGHMLTSPEIGWMTIPIDFGYPEGCVEMQWVPVEQPEQVAYVLPTVLPSPTPSMTPIPPTPVPTSAAVAACKLDILSQAIYPSDSLQGKILYASENETPFLNMGVLSSLPDVRGMRGSQLWAVAPHGKQANRLTDEHYGVAWYQSEGMTPPLWLMSNTELTVDEQLVRQIPLPAECHVPPNWDTNQRHVCGKFEISPDGKWAAFSEGDYLSGYNVRPGLINLETGETQFPTWGTGLVQFLPNNGRLVGNSWGEGEEVFWANSLTGESLRLGSGGTMVWNVDETAVAAAATSYHGFDGVVWGYNVKSGNLFLPEPQVRGVDYQPVWTLDGTHLLYQHHMITGTGTYTYTYGPGQIHIVDAIGGEQRILAFDPQYHYQLCETHEADSCRWAGDWVKVRRYPYQPDPFSFEDYQDSGFRCTWYGQDCPTAAEYLGLNWHTGEIVPWGDVVHLMFQVTPVPTAVPIPSGPNFSAAPLYANPEIGYALYVGNDGRSLYCVPEDGITQKWVQDADWFLYVPEVEE